MLFDFDLEFNGDGAPDSIWLWLALAVMLWVSILGARILLAKRRPLASQTRVRETRIKARG